MSTELAFIAHHSQDGTRVTRAGDEWPQRIVITGDLWREMVTRRCLPWAVADVSFDRIETGEHYDRPTFINGRKDGRVQFSMSDGQWSEYQVVGQNETADVYTLQYVQEGHQLPPVKLS